MPIRYREVLEYVQGYLAAYPLGLQADETGQRNIDWDHFFQLTYRLFNLLFSAANASVQALDVDSRDLFGVPFRLSKILLHLEHERCLFGLQEFFIQFLFGVAKLEVKFVNALCA